MTAKQGCATLIIAGFMIAAVILFLVAVILNSLSQWRQSANAVAVEQQHTEQVTVTQEQTTERARVEWGARTDIAEIEADATKKTSWAFAGFWLLRAATWIATIAAILVGGLVAHTKLTKAGAH